MTAILARYYCSKLFTNRFELVDAPRRVGLEVTILVEHRFLNFFLLSNFLSSGYKLLFCSTDLSLLKACLIDLRRWLSKENKLETYWNKQIAWSQFFSNAVKLKFLAFDRIELQDGLKRVEFLLADIPSLNQPMVSAKIGPADVSVHPLLCPIIDLTLNKDLVDLLRLAFIDEVDKVARSTSVSALAIFDALSKMSWSSMANLEWWQQFYEYRLPRSLSDSSLKLGTMQLDGEYWLHRDWKSFLRSHKSSESKHALAHLKEAQWLSLHMLHYCVLLYANLLGCGHCPAQLDRLISEVLSIPSDWAGVRRFVRAWGLRRIEFYICEYWGDRYSQAESLALVGAINDRGNYAT